jgi:hypothetical protein
MEPHREGQPKALERSATPKPKRFRIVKLEERIAPGGAPLARKTHFTQCQVVCFDTTNCYTGPMGCWTVGCPGGT